MRNFWIVLFHTYVTKLKTKSFIITTLVTLLLIIGLSNINKLMEFFDRNEQQQQVLLIGDSDFIKSAIEEQINTTGLELKLKKSKMTLKEAEQAVEKGTYKGLLHISLDQDELPKAIYKSMSISDTSTANTLQVALQSVKTQLAANQMNLTQKELNSLYAPVVFEKVALEKNAKTEEELNQARGLVYVLLFVIYFAVIMYSSMIAMEVATEKSSRVMEILISSVSPIQQMFAKILGIGLLSLTQLFILLGVGYSSLKRNMASMEGDFFTVFGFDALSIDTILYAIVFFLLGYFLYATLAAFLGSLVSRIEDVQQMITPMTMLMVAGFLISMFGLGQPEKSFISITSYIPFFAPMLMFMRVSMLSLPIWEPILSILILLVTIILLAIFGARVYKGGVLMYGKTNSFKNIFKAFALTKRE